MAKLPVGDTLAFSLRYGLTAVPAFLRAGWLPLAVLLSGVALLIVGATGTLAVTETSLYAAEGSESVDEAWAALKQSLHDPALFFAGIPVIIVGAILFIPVQVALVRKAAGKELPGGLTAIRFGGPEWRYIGAALLTLPIFLFAAFVAAIPAILAIVLSGGPQGFAALDGADGALPGGPLTIAAMVAGGVFLFWFTVRFSLFAVYAAVMNRIAPVSAFSITGGNFWRIVVIGGVLAILLFLIEFALSAFQIAFDALAGIAGSGIGTGEGSALAIGLAVVAVLFAAAQQIFSVLVGAGYSGRAVSILSDGRSEA